MANWTKKNVTKQQIEPLCSKYEKIDQILASIFVRRGITEGKQILYYLENDLRFQHEPFLLPNIDDAVERILQAEEEGEKILIFGDSDVDGITSTVILYDYLKKIGIDVSWRVPLGDDAYGLSVQAVEDFAKQDGTLIITVDCGISNFDAVEKANELGIDVIITDHHNPQENIPAAIVVIDPKLPESLYPFHDISGAAVAYKLVSALRFAHTDFYNSEITILDISENTEDKCFYIDCAKIRNLIKTRELHEKIVPGVTSIYDLKLPYFLQGQLIYSWNAVQTKTVLRQIFGSGIDFNINDLHSETTTVFPALRNKTSQQICSLSSFSKYSECGTSIIESLFNLYVSYCRKVISSRHSDWITDEAKDMQMAGLAALADIMPMKNENRLFVANCTDSIKKSRPRPGLAELFAKLKVNPDTIVSTDLSWGIIPALNAAGRLGKPDIALNLLLSENPKEREQLADEICRLNEERKSLVQNAVFKVHEKALASVEKHSNNFCVVVDEELHNGLTGLFAAKLMSEFGVPSFAITYSDDICIGSIRSKRGFIATEFLDNFGEFFLNHGGHNYAAGFSFQKEKLPEFLRRIEAAALQVKLDEEDSDYEIDAEIPPSYLNPDIFKLIDIFEPYGSENSELVFLSKNIKVCDAMIVGKKEPLHLKLTFECGKFKFPAMFWSQADRLKKDIAIGKNYDILYTLSRNYFNGTTTNQLVIKELKLNEN